MAVVAPAAAGLEALIGLDTLNQIVGQAIEIVLMALLAPDLDALRVTAYDKLPVQMTPPNPLSPAEAANAVIRGHISETQGVQEARYSGLNQERFNILRDSAGQPLPLLVLAEAWRRGFIPRTGTGAESVSLEQGIRESDLKDKWIPIVEKLQYQLPPVGTIIEGWLRAQLTQAQALDLANQAGVDNETATLMFKASGRPPSPQELFTLWKRGVIPKDGRGGDTLSLEQGYLETDLKDKWYETWTALAEYRPPPRTITALHRAGAIDDAMALKLYQEEGLTPEMAAIYVKTAHHERSQTAKELTKAEWVAMYVDQAISAAELRKRLASLGFTGESADLEVQLADLKIAHALETRAVNRVGTLYVGRRIDKTQAMNTLQGLKLPATQINRLLAVWSLERADNLKHLGVPELAFAVANGYVSVSEGLDVLGAQGYGARDAWIILTHHAKSDLGVPMPSDNLPPA